MSTTIACLQGAHAIAAQFSGPHWLLADDDAKAYALAINNVARHYDIAVAQKTIDITNLVGLVCFFEGTRLLMNRKPPPPARPAAQVFQFNPPPATPPAPPVGEVFGPPNPLPAEGLH